MNLQSYKNYLIMNSLPAFDRVLNPSTYNGYYAILLGLECSSTFRYLREQKH